MKAYAVRRGGFFSRGERGFTIVELLIVIVVIAILAAISVVVYVGVQERANNAKVLQLVSQYQRIMELYAVENGGVMPQADWACLGEIKDYPAENGYLEGWCYKPVDNLNPSAGDDQPVNEALNDRLRVVTSQMLPGKVPETPGPSGRTYRGIFYDSSSTITGGRSTILYYLKGNQECKNGHMQQFKNDTFSSCLLVLSSRQE